MVANLSWITANAAGPYERLRVNGRMAWKVPFTSLVEGVLNGSKGALFYPRNEIASNPGAWVGVPVTLGHPTDPSTGQPQFARNDEAVFNRVGLGEIIEDRVDGDKRKGTALIDDEYARNKSPEVHKALVSGQPIELSTGLVTQDHCHNCNERVTNGYCGKCLTSNWSQDKQGRQYKLVARNYEPDHLALLIGVRGACSLRDGCGLGVNAEAACCDECKAKKDKGIKSMLTPGEGEVTEPTANLLSRMWRVTINAILGNSNPEGHNQYTQGATGEALHKEVEKYVGDHGEVHTTIGGVTTAKSLQDMRHDLGHPKFDPSNPLKNPVHAAVKDMMVSGKLKVQESGRGHKITTNAVPNQPRHAETGAYLPPNGGTGKGEVHAAAVSGHRGKCDTCGGTLDTDGACSTCSPKDNAGTSLPSIGGATESGTGMEGDPIKVGLNMKLGELLKNSNPEGHNQYTGGGGGAMGSASHKERLESLRGKGRGVIRTKTGYKEMDAKGDTEYDHEGRITGFTPKTSSHESRFAPKKNQEGSSTDTESTNNQGDQDMSRKQQEAFLVANCDCWNGKAKLLENKELFDDATIDKLVKNEQTAQAAVQTVNAVREEFNLNVDLALNEMPAALKAAMDAKAGKGKGKAKDKADDEEPDEDDATTNREGKKKMTVKEWFDAPDSAPPEVKSAVRNAMRIEEREKTVVVNKLTAHITDAQAKKQRQAKLNALTLDELYDRLGDMPTTPKTNRDRDDGDLGDRVVNRFAQFGSDLDDRTRADVTTNEDEVELLDTMAMNWGEKVTA